MNNLDFNTAVKMMRPSASMQKGLAAVTPKYNLAIGSPDIPPPTEITELIKEFLECPDFNYKNSKGTEAALSGIYRTALNSAATIDFRKNVCLVPGAKYGIYLSLKTILNVGDSVVLFQPYWLSYPDICTSLGLNVVATEYDFQTGSYEFRKLESTLKLESVRAIVINNPNNPLGFIWSEDDLSAIIDLCARHNVWVIIDEVYKDLTFELDLDLHSSISASNVIRVGSLSKSLAIPGLRIGYVGGSSTFIEAFNLFHQHISTCISSFAVFLLERIDSKVFTDFVRYSSAIYRTRYVSAIEGLSAKGYAVLPSQGSFYCLVDVSSRFSSGEEASMYLERLGVQVTPGVHYGPQFRQHIRLCLTVPVEDLKTVLQLF